MILAEIPDLDFSFPSHHIDDDVNNKNNNKTNVPTHSSLRYYY